MLKDEIESVADELRDGIASSGTGIEDEIRIKANTWMKNMVVQSVVELVSGKAVQVSGVCLALLKRICSLNLTSH